MSEHFFRTTSNGKEVEVHTGWDEPLARFYLVVYCINNKDVELLREQVKIENYDLNDDKFAGNLLYSNLSDKNLPDQDLKYQSMTYFVSILSKFGITINEELLNQIKNERFDYLYRDQPEFTETFYGYIFDSDGRYGDKITLDTRLKFRNFLHNNVEKSFEIKVVDRNDYTCLHIKQKKIIFPIDEAAATSIWNEDLKEFI